MQTRMDVSTMPFNVDKTPASMTRAIECDEFPFEELSRIAEGESWRKEIYRPIYHVHKWWAKRLGSVFRGILIGSLTPKGTDLLKSFYTSVRFPDVVVYDPFMGSGTTIGETLKLDGHAIGRDINPVSYLQVRTALTLKDTEELKKTFREIESDVSGEIHSYYKSILSDGTSCDVLYYFWVMQVSCPECNVQIDLFSNYVFARHAYTHRNPTVHVVCPNCGAVSPKDHKTKGLNCSKCSLWFDTYSGPAKGKLATCPQCNRKFAIGSTIRDSGGPPSYRMYAKLVIKPDGHKAYQPISEFDKTLYRKAASDLEISPYCVPQDIIEPGYNTDQVLNYGFRAWNQMFNARQLLCISLLANRINQINDVQVRDAFVCLFSGTLEFNNMFASYKGEGTGAVRHMFNHHILKPERTPLEANLWGTSKSSGAFSTLFRSRILRAVDYCKDPFELGISSNVSGTKTSKVVRINKPLIGISNSETYEQFLKNRTLYISCGDSSVTDLVDECVDVVVTDPPFFDYVHYSQLADFFYTWQRMIVQDYPSHRAKTTRSRSEVQDSNANSFTKRLTLVFKEVERVLKKNGLLVFTYHHSRLEGWQSVLSAVTASRFRIVACHPVRSEMSVATPKNQAKSPINFDIILVCRKVHSQLTIDIETEEDMFDLSTKRAESQISRLKKAGWKLSRSDIGVIIMAQVIAGVSRQLEMQSKTEFLKHSVKLVQQAIERIHLQDTEQHPTTSVS